MSNLQLADAGRVCRTAVLDALGLSKILWSFAAITALARHTDTVRVSPGGVLKAAEYYNQALSLCAPVAAYREIRYGTQDSGSFDMLDVRTGMPQVVGTRAELYDNLCKNVFIFMARGPAALKQYIDDIVMRTEGARTSLEQFFAAVRVANNSVTDAIDRMRRRTYAVKVTSEVAMVCLGAGPISLGVQVGVGLGYTLVTQAITSYSGLSQADIIAMPARHPRPADSSLGEVARQNVISTGLNVGQEAGDFAAEALAEFDKAQLRALAREEGKLLEKVGRIAAKSGAGRERVSKAALNTIKDLTDDAERVAAQRIAGQGASTLRSVAIKGSTRAIGVGVGLYFLREDMGNLISFVANGDL
jgi:hypothetical protein